MPDREKVIMALEKGIATAEAIETIAGGFVYITKGVARNALELLKGQEPVIRCKDCKHYAVEDYYGNFHGYEILAASDIPTCHRWGNDACMVKPDGYCFLAEGR